VIRIQGISIREFRGIRDLTLDLAGKNFAVCGPNGTGKSGIVDAIEFALTGNISRLSGSGTGGLTVKEHAPHVDCRNNPEKSWVSIRLDIPSLNKTVAVTRKVSDPRKPNITPNDKSISAILGQIQSHPEFTLSRRELIRYVLSEPGKRAKEVQALLRLDELETIRATLQKIANAEDKSVTLLTRAQKDAADNLQRGLAVTQVTAAKLLEVVNARRVLLELPTIAALDATTALNDGVVSTAGAAPPTRIPKIQAQSDLRNLDELLVDVVADNTLAIYRDRKGTVGDLAKDAASLNGIERQELLESALKQFDEEHCPVCDTEWAPDKFRDVVNRKLRYLQGVAGKRKALELKLSPIADSLEKLSSSLSAACRYATLLLPPLDMKAAADHAAVLLKHALQLRKLLPLELTEASLDAICLLPDGLKSAIGELSTKVAALPEPSQQEAAREFLTVAQERLGVWRTTTLKLRAAQERSKLAAAVVEQYGKQTTVALEQIYAKVETTFRDLYRAINGDDEEKFEAKLTPSMGKLGFDVDFYGRGFFPPGAYHSEGHQDGMGLCLYLALMSYLVGDQFTFAVLDDVLMSVDSGHRREVSKLLRTRFPNTQFVMTTHDGIWLRHMQSDGLIVSKGFAHFRTWDVEHGPSDWTETEVWDDIVSHVSRNDISQAAGLLRRYLEHLSHEVCHRLRARVEFRGDAQFMLGDLLPSAIGAMRQLLKAGKSVSQSWGNTVEFEKLQVFETDFARTIATSQVENWQINAAVHYNQWATLGKGDFGGVLKSYRELAVKFRCDACHALLYVVPERGPTEMLRCSCNAFNVNLISKPKS
jgi:recombinational DNA repair ATPase RecF